MLLVQCHGKVGTGIFELPLYDFAGSAVKYGDLIDGGEIDKNARAARFQLERLGMCAECEVLSDALIGGGVEGAHGTVTVADVHTLAGGVVAQLVGVIGELDGANWPVSIAIKNLAGAAAAVGDHNTVAFRDIGHSLGFVQAATDGVNAPAPVNIHDFHGIVAIDCGKDAAALDVHSHVIEPPLGAGQGDNAHQHQWLELLVSGDLLGRKPNTQNQESKNEQRPKAPLVADQVERRNLAANSALLTSHF